MFTQLTTRRALRSPLFDLLLGPHGADRYTELVDPLWTSAPRATVVDVERRTPRSLTMRLRPNRPVGRRAGQHLAVTVEIDGRRHRRCYSPAGEEGAELIELTVTRHDGGVVSEYLADHARPGMVVDLGEAAGDFVLPEERPRRLVLLAGGSGITAVMAMLRTLRAEGHDGHVALLYYARTAADACYLDELRAMARAMDGVRVLLSPTRGSGGDLDGHFSEHHLAAAMVNPDAVYVCGPPALVDAVRAVRPDAVAESFAPRPLIIPDSPGGGRITFRDSGITAEDDGRPILEQAEAAGLRPEHGCRMGICHTCTRRKVRGAVRNLTTGTLGTAGDEDIQICVSAPVGDVEIAL